MNSEVLHLKKNFRYNLIKIDEDYYILDRDKPYFLVYFLPFIYWMVPKRAIKISAESAHQLQTIKHINPDKGGASFAYAGTSMAIANFLGPLAYMFEIDLPPLLAGFIVFLLLSSALYFRFTVSKTSKRSLMRQLGLHDNLYYCTMWVVPKSLKRIGLLLIISPVFLYLIAGGVVGFIRYGSLFILFVFTFLFTFYLFLNSATVLPGKNTMRFWVRQKRTDSLMTKSESGSL
ncbi:DUF443 family protein [Terribacillus saccharophilus]|uniref:DUF443 family protein n=1 Tax=Terribacillus saccharophilus TaxID=361277 RepID=UPI00398289E9